MNTEATSTKSKLVVARFSVPEDYQSATLDQAVQELKALGVVTYAVEVAGGGVPILDIEGATYVGEREILAAVNERR